MAAQLGYWIGQFQSWQNDLAVLAMIVIVALALFHVISGRTMIFAFICVALLFTIVSLIRGAPTG
jgi:hypothetical protein